MLAGIGVAARGVLWATRRPADQSLRRRRARLILTLLLVAMFFFAAVVDLVAAARSRLSAVLLEEVGEQFTLTLVLAYALGLASVPAVDLNQPDRPEPGWRSPTGCP